MRFASSVIETETTLAERFVQSVLHGSDKQARQDALKLLNQHPKRDWFSLGSYGTYVQRLSMSAEVMDNAAVERLKQQFPLSDPTR